MFSDIKILKIITFIAGQVPKIIITFALLFYGNYKAIIV
jgi:hypothetical protein